MEIRASALDRFVHHIQVQTAWFKCNCGLVIDDERAGERFEFRHGDSVTPAWCLASGRQKDDGQPLNLLLLADNNGTVVRTVPVGFGDA